MAITQIKNQNNPDLSLLPDIFSEFPDIKVVYLFGSAASGKKNRESDLDLAYLTDDRSSKRQYLELLARLAGKGFCHVDLVSLDTSDIVLKFEAVSSNVLIYKRDDFDHGSYYSKIVRQYLDFLPYLNTQRAAYKRRILHGQT